MATQEEVKERRQSDRLPIPLKVDYYLKAKPWLSGQTHSVDSSGGGIKLVFSQPVSRKTTLSLSLHFPDSPEPIKAVGQVSWCKKAAQNSDAAYTVGVKYVKFSREDQERFTLSFCELMLRYHLESGAANAR